MLIIKVENINLIRKVIAQIYKMMPSTKNKTADYKQTHLNLKEYAEIYSVRK